jgi:HD superfamily phosphohydrolase YqeK
MTSLEERVKIFEKELDLIFDLTIKEFTRLCLLGAPDYFFVDCPASSTGKYHPLNELGSDGTIIHTKKVVTIAYELCRGLGCENNRDEIISACIIHDLVKQGWKQTGHTHKMHPLFGAQLIERVQKETNMLGDGSYEIIKNCVKHHYGIWSHSSYKKKLDDYTAEELTVYLADYIASKRCLEVYYKR